MPDGLAIRRGRSNADRWARRLAVDGVASVLAGVQAEREREPYEVSNRTHTFVSSVVKRPRGLFLS